MKVKIRKRSDKAVIPQLSHSSDAGLDLTATSLLIVDEGDYGYYDYGTDLSISIPENHVGLIFPRSSISKTGMLLCNAVGVVDSGYLGEIRCRFKYIKGTKAYEVGERIAQLIILPYPPIELEEVEQLGESSRMEEGFGSTNVD